MNEEVQQDQPVSPEPAPKQFIMVLDALAVAIIGRLCPGLKFLEVEGMVVETNPGHQFLVNPMAKPEAPPVEVV